MRILIAGSSGLIGSAVTDLLVDQHHEVVRLVRRPALTASEIQWDPTQPLDASTWGRFDAVINLAGAGVGDHRWTPRYKQLIRDSRVLTTQHLCDALAALPNPPSVLINASAIGWYGDTGAVPMDETSPGGRGFLAQVCEEWEAATTEAAQAGIRVVLLRTGLVVSSRGGAWARLIPLFRAGVGGRLGNGQQFWSAISLHDAARAIAFCLDHPISGPVNLTCPGPQTNAQITKTMAEVLGRSAVLPVPSAALRLIVGEFADETLGSQRVLPKRLMDAGFEFDHPTFESALRATIDSNAMVTSGA